ncbi:MAG: Asp23/Gls24 family envelope stress response protein [Coriobacteriales bacterium]|jgi:uncharacterized alkaline shock family protein YloU|nr:Asp23/Gls24 family envelope stress response protein [Coriobacteriales bacterium]
MKSTDEQEVIIAPGVAESIVALAIAQVDGVAQIGSKAAPAGSGLLGILTKRPSGGGVLILEDDGRIIVDVHLKLYYGYKLQEVAATVRAAISDALLTQACIDIDRVDITVDGIIFKI